VQLAGGPEALLRHARAAFDAGDYRWVVEVVNHLVFADPTNEEARHLQADALEQLGYQSESATFRNAFLTGAHELRNGRLPSRPAQRSGYLDAMTTDQLLDSAAVRLRAEAVGGVEVMVNLTLTDLDERWVVGLSHRALHTVAGRHDPAAAVTLRLTRSMLDALVTGAGTVVTALAEGRLEAEGDAAAADQIFGNLEVFMTQFPIVEP
jgi:alkyl sulfatase BDS1-like metallo-beta-lactamase superfamily hydrolase